jgi:high-affinity nickel permease
MNLIKKGYSKLQLVAAFAIVALFSSAAFAQEETDTFTEHTETLTDGLSSVFASILGVIIPIILTITAIAWFMKLRNKA